MRLIAMLTPVQFCQEVYFWNVSISKCIVNLDWTRHPGVRRMIEFNLWSGFTWGRLKMRCYCCNLSWTCGFGVTCIEQKQVITEAIGRFV